MLEHEMV